MKAASAKDIVLKIWHSKDGPVADKPPASFKLTLCAINRREIEL